MTMAPDFDRHPTPTTAAPGDSYVDWPAILAGAVVAYGLLLLLATFGSAIGLSMISPEPGEGVSLRWLSIAAGLWFIWITISSFAAGGYLAGRMRRKIGDANADEVETRDGGHGVIVWAVAGVFAATMAATGVANVIGGAASAAGATAGTVAETMEGAVDYYAGVALRSDAGTVTSDPAVRQEVASVLTRSLAQGEVTEADRAYLASVVASATGTAPETARAQVDAAITQADAAWQQAVDAANQARIAAAIAAFVAAATMLVAGAAAYFAATIGGEHRDRNIGFRTFGR